MFIVEKWICRFAVGIPNRPQSELHNELQKLYGNDAREHMRWNCYRMNDDWTVELYSKLKVDRSDIFTDSTFKIF